MYHASDTSSRPPQSEFTPDVLKALGVQTLSEWKNDRLAIRAATAPRLSDVSNASDSAVRSPLPPPTFVPPTPIPLGGPRSTESIQRLYQLSGPRGVVPKFEYEPAGQQWLVTLKLGETVLVRGMGPFASHQEGKEAAAKKACVIVEGWPVLGRLRGGDQGDGGNGTDGQEEEEENWVGLLTEFSQNVLHSQPLFQIYLIGQQTFSTTATLATLPSAPVFGDRHTPFNTKKAAKANASREAVLWLRSNGHMPESGAASTKKSKLTLAAEAMASGTGLGKVDVVPLPAGKVEIPTSYAQRVNTLREQLGLPTPMYHLLATPGTALYSGTATFEVPGSGPLPEVLRGRLAEVKDVFGKKNAKEECARGLVMLLNKALQRVCSREDATAR